MDKYMTRTYLTSVGFLKNSYTISVTNSNSGGYTEGGKNYGKGVNGLITNSAFAGYTDLTSVSSMRVADSNSAYAPQNKFYINGNFPIDTDENSVFYDDRFCQRGSLHLKEGQYPAITTNYTKSKDAYGLKFYNFALGFYFKIPNHCYEAMKKKEKVWTGRSICLDNDIGEVGILNSTSGLESIGYVGHLAIHPCVKNPDYPDSFFTRITLENMTVAQVEYKLKPDTWYHFLFARDWAYKDYSVYRLYINGILSWECNFDPMFAYYQEKFNYSLNNGLDFHKTYGTSSSTAYTTTRYIMDYNKYKSTFSSSFSKPKLLASGQIMASGVSNFTISYAASAPALKRNVGFTHEASEEKVEDGPSQNTYYQGDCFFDDIFFCNDYLTDKRNFEVPRNPFILSYPDGELSNTVFDITQIKKDWGV